MVMQAAVRCAFPCGFISCRRDVVECLPASLYKARQVVGEVVFSRYVVVCCHLYV